MAATIGGVSCDFVHRRQVADLKERVDVWQVPGVSGYGSQLLGRGDAEIIFVGVKFGTNAAVNTWKASIEALQGLSSLVTIVDDWGDTHSSLVLTRVDVIKTADQGNGGCRGEVTVRGVKTA